MRPPVSTDLFHNPQRYGDMAGWRAEALRLHAVGPIHRVETDDFAPFWAVIGHDEVMQVERDPDLFTNAPLPVLTSNEMLQLRGTGRGQIRTLIHMDAPDHIEYRNLTNDWFKPANVQRLQSRLDELAEDAIHTLERAGGEIEFSSQIAVPFPLQVILAIMGLPTDDYPRMLKLTQELFGAEDPDLQRETGSPEERAAVLEDFYSYFMDLTAQRRANQTDDLASLIANGTIRNTPLPDLETMGYYVIIATAGHDTTSAAMCEGMQRLAENPKALATLRANPELIPNAVDEMIRLSSPVRHFMRTAQRPAEVGGQSIEEGDWLLLSYTAANVDPALFAEPLRFDVTRENASRHLAFGFGVHFCLGAQLARLELRTLFAQLVARLDTIELAGSPTTSKATFVSGHKTLPIRYTLIG